MVAASKVQTSFPPSRSLRFKRGRRSRPEKATKRKEPSHSKAQQQTQNKRSFFLSGVYHQTLNLKFTIVFLLLLPHFPLSLWFFVFFLFNSYQFRQHHRRCRGRCSWPTMSDSVDPQLRTSDSVSRLHESCDEAAICASASSVVSLRCLCCTQA